MKLKNFMRYCLNIWLDNPAEATLYHPFWSPTILIAIEWEYLEGSSYNFETFDIFKLYINTKPCCWKLKMTHKKVERMKYLEGQKTFLEEKNVMKFKGWELFLYFPMLWNHNQLRSDKQLVEDFAPKFLGWRMKTKLSHAIVGQNKFNVKIDEIGKLTDKQVVLCRCFV